MCSCAPAGTTWSIDCERTTLTSIPARLASRLPRPGMLSIALNQHLQKALMNSSLQAVPGKGRIDGWKGGSMNARITQIIGNQEFISY